MELRASARAIWNLLDPVPRVAAGNPAGRSLPQSAAVRNVPLACDGSDPVHREIASDDPGAWMAVAVRGAEALPPPPGRHRQHRALVPDGAARDVPGHARSQWVGGGVGARPDPLIALTPNPSPSALGEGLSAGAAVVLPSPHAWGEG